MSKARRRHIPAPQGTVVAHRGLSVRFPENSRPAFAEAFASGVMTVECDVRLTKDKIPVVIHDKIVDRVSNGHGTVGSMTLEELQALDFSRDGSGLEILTLEELLQMLAHNPGSHLFLETKHPDTYSLLLEKKVCRLLRAYGSVTAGSVTIISFSLLSLVAMRWLLPECPTIYLRRDWYPLWWKAPAVLVGAGCGVGFSKEEYAKHPAVAHQPGHHRYVFTVNELDDIERFRRLGLDTIATDIADKVAPVES